MYLITYQLAIDQEGESMSSSDIPCWVKCTIFPGTLPGEYAVTVGNTELFADCASVRVTSPVTADGVIGEIKGSVFEDDVRGFMLVYLPYTVVVGSKSVKVPADQVLFK